MRRFASALGLATSLCVLPTLAHAQASHAAGDHVTLAATRLSIELPLTSWIVSIERDGAFSYDVLTRDASDRPRLVVKLSRPTTTCANARELFAKLSADPSAVVALGDASTWLPAGWEPWVYSIRTGTPQYKACASTARGVLLATFEAADGDESSQFIVRSLLDAALNASGGHVEGTMPAAAPATRAHLSVLNVDIDLPDASWSVSTFTDKSGSPNDVIERAGPGNLRVMVGRSPTCRIPNDSRIVYDAPYMPAGYGNQAGEVTLDGGYQVAGMCAPLSRGGYLVTTVGYAGPLFEAGAARPVLSTVLSAVERGEPGRSDTARPSGGGSASTSKDGKLWAHLDFGLSLANPSSPGTESSTAGYVGLEFLYASPTKRDDYVGWSFETGGYGGGGSHSIVPWDAHISVGGALHFGPMWFTPLVGVGGNGMQGDPSFFNLPSAAYWMVGGYATLKFSENTGMSLGGWKTGRSNDTFSDEIRLQARLFFDHWGLAFAYSTFPLHATPVLLAGATSGATVDAPYVLSFSAALGF